jgi:hypothetical protein
MRNGSYAFERGDSPISSEGTREFLLRSRSLAGNDMIARPPALAQYDECARPPERFR